MCTSGQYMCDKDLNDEEQVSYKAATSSVQRASLSQCKECKSDLSPTRHFDISKLFDNRFSVHVRNLGKCFNRCNNVRLVKGQQGGVFIRRSSIHLTTLKTIKNIPGLPILTSLIS